MPLFVEGGGFRFRTQSVGGFWSWELDSQNQQGVGQLYFVKNIETPYGPLTTTMIPLPGDVVLSMAESLSQVQQQLSPSLILSPPAQTTFTVTVSEGGPEVKAGTVTVQNAGAFGSFMSAFATPSSPWLKVTPSVANGIGKNEQASFDIFVVPSTLLAASSPYSGVVVFQDNKSPPTIIPVTVNAVVLPRPVVVASPATTTLTYTICTNTPGPSQQIIVQNAGPAGSIMGFSVSKLNNNSSWLSFSPDSGSGIQSGGSALVTVAVVPAGAPLFPGTYTEILRVSASGSVNGYVDVTVQLVVSP